MKSFRTSCLLISFLLLFLNCEKPIEKATPQEEHRERVEMVTNYGTMIIELYNETPLHRDNFINLARNRAFDSLLFHRVIHEFMIQGGDPESKTAAPDSALGSGDAPYVVKAEINSTLFHKKGVLAAARDDNPEKASSAMQFYIVQGKVHNDSLLDRAEIYTSQNKAQDYYRNTPDKKPLLDSIRTALYSGKRDRYDQLMDSILSLALAEKDFTPYVMPENFREVYKDIGGYPRLDQNYTVFGEVVEGIEVVDSIAKVSTNPANRPVQDVRIQSVRVLNN